MLQNKQETLDDRKPVETKLSVHPDIEPVLSKFQREFLDEELSTLPPIKEGDINIFTAYIFDMGDKYESEIYIRNGLKKNVNFEDLALNIVDKEGNVVASEKVDLRQLGKVPPMSARPWKIYFDKENVKAENLSTDKYKVVFDKQTTAKSTVDVKLENIPQGIGMQLKQQYQEFLNNLPKISRGEVSFTVYSLEKNENGDVDITVMIRNGSNKSITIEEVPLKLVDKQNNTVVAGKFQLKEENLQVSSMAAILYRFVFPEQVVQNKEANLEECKVKFSM